MAGRAIFPLGLFTVLLNSRLFVSAASIEEDFTSNLMAGLTPYVSLKSLILMLAQCFSLLSLFGEKFAQQFLSEFFTFWDRIRKYSCR